MKFAYYADYIYYNNKPHADSYLLVDDETITGISDTCPDDYTKYISENSAIFPGFVNTHTHLPMGFFRGIADDLPLMEWLQNHIWPAETKWLSDEFVHQATLLAACEMIRSGTICANDMYFFSDEIASALITAGLKGVVGVGVLDFPTKYAAGPDGYIDKAAELYNKYEDNPLIDIALCPHAPYTVSPENYKKCIDFASKHDILIHTHLAETEWEVQEITEKYGKPPAALMDEIGLFDVRSIFAHCVHLTDDEIEIMGRKNVNVSLCIESNLKLANGFAPVRKLEDAGCNLTVGTDGAASNNNLDMLTEVSNVSKIHKALSKDPTYMCADSSIRFASENGAKALGLRQTGTLKKGNKADFMVISYDNVMMTPVYNHLSHLIYTAGPHDIKTLFVNGKCLMENGYILTIDEEEVKENARSWAEKIKTK